MVPLPNFLYNNFSSALQLLSSQLGVQIIRLFGISVYLEGNVIDLGSYQLQVVEACSGLRYLFPLSALGYIAAVVFRGSRWKKALLFLSTLPIAVAMNSLRIGVIGVLVNYAGIGMAEGFLHDFEGWAVFMVCTAILVGEIAVLARIGRHPMPLREAFSLEGPEPLPATARFEYRRLSAPFYVVFAVLLVVMAASQFLPRHDEQQPERREFVFFPMDIGDWRGRTDRLEAQYLNSLKLDDYLLANYTNSSGDRVNLYVAYYGRQRAGVSAHSPKSCLPGAGWRIQEFSQREIAAPGFHSGSLGVNRSLIQMGNDRLLVYYWFQQRGRIITNEYLVKWYLLLDAIRRHRTDGALIRVTMQAPANQDVDSKDRILSDFVSTVESQLKRFIPE